MFSTGPTRPELFPVGFLMSDLSVDKTPDVVLPFALAAENSRLYR